jgi:endonuclease III
MRGGRTGGRADRRTGGPADRRTGGGRPGKVAGPTTQIPKKRAGKRARPTVRRSARPPAPARELLARLKTLYPDARCALDYRNPYELLCATILSAQCTDVRVNMVTPTLFARYPTPHELARADQIELQEIIKSTGFFRNKARSLIGMAQAVVADHAGEVPRTMEALRRLPGVGRKTANVVLGNAFRINEGVTVDTHVTRLSGLLGLSKEKDPVKIEQHLMKLFPQDDWALLSHLLIFHGRQICVARRPRCGDCVLRQLCPSSLV